MPQNLSKSDMHDMVGRWRWDTYTANLNKHAFVISLAIFEKDMTYIFKKKKKTNLFKSNLRAVISV